MLRLSKVNTNKGNIYVKNNTSKEINDKWKNKHSKKTSTKKA